jgi:hypothetical protein
MKFKCSSCLKDNPKKNLNTGDDEKEWIPKIPEIPPLPISNEQLRSVILKGTQAFVPNLFRPTIRTKGKHAYVMPSECIKLFLATGNYPMEFNCTSQSEDYKEARETPRGVEIALATPSSADDDQNSFPHISLSYVEWKDDCESSKSNKVSKTGSLWIWTITLFPKGKTRDSPRCTFPICIGPKKESHDQVEKIISDDMKKLSTTRMLGVMGKKSEKTLQVITFSASMYLSLGDQPERRGANKLQMGNSGTHARWRHICDHYKLINAIPACQDCLKMMKEADSPEGGIDWVYTICEKCTNWLLVNPVVDNPLLLYELPHKYPNGYTLGVEEVEPEERMAKPKELNYELLRKVVTKTHLQVVLGKWTPAEAMCVLKTNCINEHFSKVIVQRAKNCASWLKAQEERNIDPEKYARIDRLRQKYPKQYAMAPFPAVWGRGVGLEKFVDTPMHLLFLGIAKAIFQLITIWAKRSGRYNEFHGLAVDKLSELESLKLQWLTFHVKTFGKWGGWVSEKYQSLSRVCLWIYGPLISLDEVPQFVEPTDRTVDKWLVSQYQGWLKIRGLPVEGKRKELHDRVLFYYNQPDNLKPKILPPQYGSAEGVMDVLRAMVLLFTTILQASFSGKNHATILSLRVRLFLNSVEEMEKKIRPHKKIIKRKIKKKDESGREFEDVVTTERPTMPIWLTKYNFLSLLNLPDSLREFGSPRNYFEGKYLGERYVQEVKNVRGRCPPRNLHLSMLRKLYEAKALDFLGGDKEEAATETTEKKRELTGNVKIYPGKTNALFSFHSKKPMSIVESEAGEFGILYYQNGSNRGEIKFYMIERIEEEQTIHHGMRYWKWRSAGKELDFEAWRVKDFCVLLPKIGRDFENEYTIVTKEWSPIMLEHYEYSKIGIVKPEESGGWI